MWFVDLPARTRSRLHTMAAGLSSVWLLGVAVASLTAICAIVGLMLYASRVEIARDAQIDAGNLLEAVSEDEKRNIESLDLSLRAVRDAARDREVMALPPKFQREILFDRSATAKDVEALLVLDRDGRVVVDSAAYPPRPARFGDKDFFRAHSQRADTGLFISRPFLSPFGGEWTVALSRRVEAEDGSFAGVAVAMMKLAFWDKLFSNLDVGPNGSMALFGLDGTLFMRHPLNEHDVGRVRDPHLLFPALEKDHQGTYEGLAKSDGTRRIFYYRQVGDLPLVQSVGFAVDDLYMPWWRKTAVTAAALLALCTTIISLLVFLQAELRRRICAEAAFAQLASTDKLTGLPNRRKFDDVLETEWRRAGRAETALALLLIDVDHFKPYNDRYGHPGGDAVLAALGACLERALKRPGDFAARYGGEEFVVLLPNTDARGALKMAEKVRNRVADLLWPHEGSEEGCVTVSVGVATLKPRSGQPAAELVLAADHALYKAKNTGRNRTVLGRANELKSAA